jgi:hypothetical protein
MQVLMKRFNTDLNQIECLTQTTKRKKTEIDKKEKK